MRFVFRLLLTVGAACFLALPSLASCYGIYSVVAPVAIDGDTIKGDVLIWPGLTAHASIRVLGIDTPELKSPLACERSLAIKAREFTDAWLVANYPVSISDVQPDKYGGRIDAHVRGLNGNLLAGALLAAGHARPYNSGTRQPWCQ